MVLIRETEVLGEKPVPVPLVHCSSHVDWSGFEPEPYRREDGACLCHGTGPKD